MCEYFKLSGELEDEELNILWKKYLNGKEYLKNKIDIIVFMEKLGLLVKCNLKWLYYNKIFFRKEIFWYFVLSMRKGNFDEISFKLYIGFIIFCFEFEKK